MVNTTTDAMASSLPLFSVSPSKLSKLNNDNFIQSISSSLFNLSKPFNLSHKLKSKNDSSFEYNPGQFNYTASFTFPEPFESYHVNYGIGGGGKLLTKQNSNKRLQPYSLSKPKPNVSRDDNNATSLSISKSSSDSSTSSDKSQSQTNNPILSRLSNISNSLKSIFVRPKHIKPVDLESFNHGANDTQSTNQSEQSEGTKFKINLFSVGQTSPDVIMNNSEPFGNITNNSMQVDMNQKLEKIISRNIMLESYTNKLSKANANQTSGLMSPLRNFPKHSETSSSISSMSSAHSSNEINMGGQANNNCGNNENLQSTSQHQRALQMSHRNTMTKPESSFVRQQVLSINSTTNNSTPNKGSISKWTCMVCLSKHIIDVKICSICGSANSDSVNKAPVQLSINNIKLEKSTKKLFNDMNDSLAVNRVMMQNSPLRSLNNNIGPLKTWKCNDCNFANDNLKIVCMNCRASKKQHSTVLEPKFGHQTLQTKRKPTINVHSNGFRTLDNRSKLNRSNEENEHDSDNEEERHRVSKRSRKQETSEQLCKSCKNCLQPPVLHVGGAKTPTQCGESTQKKSTETPMRPKFLETAVAEQAESAEALAKTTAEPGKESQPDLVRPNSLLFASMANTAKWSCSTCLVSNDPDKSACVCCQTKRPEAATTTSKAESAPKPTNSLFAAAASASSKWSCSTCLVANDADKTACACCQTKKPGAATGAPAEAAKKPNGLFAAAAANASKWSCSTCLTNNDSDKAACVCCQTKKPGASTAVQAGKPSNQSNPLFAAAQQKSGSKWECSTCLVSNDADKTSCVCCSTAKPGTGGGEVTKTKFSSLVAAAGTLSSTSSSISFGLNAAKAGESTPGGISFGASSFGSKPSEAGISFGATPTAAPISFGAASGGFSFGAKPEEPKTSTAGGFGFGARTEEPKSGFSFGATKTDEAKPSAPFFGTASSSASTSFLSGSNPFSNKESTENKVFAFQQTNMTGKQEEAPKAAFGFSGLAAATTTASDAARPVFGFGSSSTETSKPAFGGFGGGTSTSEPAKSTFGGFGSSTATTETVKAAFGFGSSSTTEPAKPAFGGFGSSTIAEPAKPAFDGFGSSNTTEAAKPAFGGFGNSTTAEAPKPAFGFLNSSTTEPAKPAFGGFGSSSTAEAPKSAFGFGNTSTSTESQKSVFGSSNSISEPSTNMFGSSTTKPASSAFAFGATPTTPVAPTTQSSFNFGGSTNPPVFGASTSSSSTASSSGANVFGQLNQNTTGSNNKSAAFNFGGSNVSQSPAPFQFGGSNQKVNDENKPLAFNFGGSNSNSGFNFGAANNTDSPLKLPAAQPAGSPFVFGGAANNNRATDSPSLAQVLAGPPSTPSITASGRPIKKATRMRKK